MEFTPKTFKITENVSFSILMAYFDGHPICQTKSLKLMYHGQLQEMKSGNRLFDVIINHGLQTQEALNLLNYLSRLIYGENVYEVYVNNSNQSDYVSEMKEYITHNQSGNIPRLNKRFDLIDEIKTDTNKVIQEELANYLARLIYGVNMFDIYRNQVEDEHTVNELNSYVFRGENNLPSAREVNERHEYINNLLLESIICH